MLEEAPGRSLQYQAAQSQFRAAPVQYQAAPAMQVQNVQQPAYPRFMPALVQEPGPRQHPQLLEQTTQPQSQDTRFLQQHASKRTEGGIAQEQKVIHNPKKARSQANQDAVQVDEVEPAQDEIGAEGDTAATDSQGAQRMASMMEKFYKMMQKKHKKKKKSGFKVHYDWQTGEVAFGPQAHKGSEEDLSRAREGAAEEVDLKNGTKDSPKAKGAPKDSTELARGSAGGSEEDDPCVPQCPKVCDTCERWCDPESQENNGKKCGTCVQRTKCEGCAECQKKRAANLEQQGDNDDPGEQLDEDDKQLNQMMEVSQNSSAQESKVPSNQKPNGPRRMPPPYGDGDGARPVQFSDASAEEVYKYFTGQYSEEEMYNYFYGDGTGNHAGQKSKNM